MSVLLTSYLIELNAYLLLLGAHVRPSALAFLLHSAFGSLSAQVISNDGAGMLHVEEIRCQGPLGRVGIMSALLALLLLLYRGSQLRDRHYELRSGILKGGQQVILRTFGSGLAKQKISLADIVDSERAQKLEDSGETVDSL